MLNQQVHGYDGENFELRERLFEASSSFQLMIYPRCMVVNNTMMPLIIDNQRVNPISNDFVISQREQLSIKVPGYTHQIIDTNTIGVAGALILDLDDKNEVLRKNLP